MEDRIEVAAIARDQDMAFFKMSEGVFDLNPTAINTGTAQIKIAGKTQYTYIGWFVAFAPIKNPQITFV